MKIHHDLEVGVGDSKRNIESAVSALDRLEATINRLSSSAEKAAGAFENIVSKLSGGQGLNASAAIIDKLGSSIEQSGASADKAADSFDAMSGKIVGEGSQSIAGTTASIDRLGASIEKSGGSAERAAEDLEKLGEGLENKNVPSTEDADSALRSLMEALEQSGESAEESAQAFDGMAGGLSRIAASMGIAVSATAFVKQMAGVRGQFQQLEVAFTTMLQSEEKAADLMAQLVDTAAKTPFDLEGVAQGAKQLLAYGTASEEVNETLVRLGDIAAGLSIPLGDMVYLFGTTMTQGRLFTQDLRQFMGRGIPLAEELAKQFGVTKDKIGEMVTAGQIGAEEVKKAIWAMTDAGGRFGGLMDEQSKTISGQIANIGDAIDTMFNEIGKSSEGIINGTLSVVSNLVENYEKVGKVVAGLIATYGSYKAATMTMAAIQKLQSSATLAQLKNLWQYRNTLSRATLAQAAFNTVCKANVYVLLASAIIGVVTALVSFRKKQKEARLEVKETTEAISKETTELDALMKIAKDEKKSKKERKDAIEGINARYGDYLDNLLTEKNSAEELSAAYDKLTASITAKYLAQLREQKVGEKQSVVNTSEAALKARISEIVSKSGLSAKSQGALLGKIESWMNSEGKYQNAPEVLDYIRKQYALFTRDSLKGKDITGLNTDIWNLQKARETLRSAEKWQDDFEAGFSSFGKKVAATSEKNAEEVRRNLSDVVADIKKYQSEVKSLQDKFTSEGFTDAEANAYETAKASLEAALSEYEKYTGKKYGSTDKSAKELNDELKSYNDLVKKSSKEAERAQVQAQWRTDAAVLSAREDGFAKRRSQLDAQLAQEYQRIQWALEDELEAIEDADRRKYKAEHGGSDKGFVFNAESNDLARMAREKAQDEELASIAEYNANVEQLNREHQQQLLESEKAYLLEYGDYQQKRATITADYQKRIAKAQEEGDAFLAKTLSNKMSEELYNLQKQYDASFALIFADAENLTKNQLVEAIKATEEEMKKAMDSGNVEAYVELLERLNALHAEADKGQWGIGAIANGIRGLQKAADDYEKATSPEGRTKAVADKDRSMSQISKGFQDVIGTFDTLGSKMEKLGGTLGDIGAGFSSMASSFSSNWGNIQTAMKGGKGSGIAAAQAIFNGVLDMAVMIGGQLEENRKIQEEWNRTLRETAHEYDMLQLEALDYKQKNIFGVENPYQKAIDGALQYSKAMEILRKSQDELANGQVQTGTKKAVSWKNVGVGAGSGAAVGAAVGTLIPGIGNAIGAAVGAAAGAIVGSLTALFAAKKRVPVFDSLLKNYGWLYDDKTYELNPRILADYKKLDEDTRQIVDNWEEVRKKALEAEEQMRQNFADLAGDIGDELSNKLADAFRNNELYSAVDDFHDYMTGVIEDIIEQLAFSAVFGDLFGNLEEGMRSSFSSGGDYSIVDDLMGFMKQYPALLETYREQLEEAKRQAAESGYDLWMPGWDESERRSASKGIAQASQDTVDELNGRATAIQGHTYSIAESSRQLVGQCEEILRTLFSIDGHAARLDNMDIELTRLRRDVTDIAVNGVKIR